MATDYTVDMSIFKDFLDIPKVEGWSGQDIHNLIETVEDDYNFHFNVIFPYCHQTRQN